VIRAMSSTSAKSQPSIPEFQDALIRGVSWTLSHDGSALLQGPTGDGKNLIQSGSTPGGQVTEPLDQAQVVPEFVPEYPSEGENPRILENSETS
jgi:hypothetical protein